MKQILVLFLITCSAVLSGCSVELGPATRVDKVFTEISDINLSAVMSIGGVKVEESSDENLHITYYEYDLIKYSTTKNAHGLELKQSVDKDIWGTENPLPVTISIPSHFTGNFTSSMSAGNIIIENLLTKINDINISLKTGSINIVNTSAANNLILKVNVGNLVITDIAVPTIDLEVDTGEIILANIAANKSIILNTKIGSINGSIKGYKGDFTISSKTNIGDNNLANSSGGKKTLNATVDIGNVNIKFTP